MNRYQRRDRVQAWPVPTTLTILRPDLPGGKQTLEPGDYLVFDERGGHPYGMASKDFGAAFEPTAEERLVGSHRATTGNWLPLEVKTTAGTG